MKTTIVNRSKRVLILRGLQGSGKTTYAKQFVDSGLFKRINYDSLRWYDVKGNPKDYKFSAEAEQQIKSAATSMATTYLKSGYGLVIDNTNLNPDELNYWVRFAESHAAIAEIVEFDTDIDTCIAQNDQREGWQKVPRPVIERAALKANRILWPTKPAVIVDIDGVLADNTHRMHFIQPKPDKVSCFACKDTGKCTRKSCCGGTFPCDICDGDSAKAKSTKKKDWDAFFATVSEDEPIRQTIQWVRMLRDQGYYIILVTGRPLDRTGVQTIEWLQKHEVPYDRIFMRHHNEFAKAGELKEKILRMIQRYKPITFAIDDQPTVLEMYERNGVKAYNVGTGEDYF